VRAPKELVNIKVSDLQEKDGVLWLTIRKEISKTYGSTFDLPLSKELVKNWIKTQKLTKDDYLFKITPYMVNRYIKRLGYNILKIGKPKSTSKGQGKTRLEVEGGLTMYDFRHCSACFYITKTKDIDRIMKRFRWKDPTKIYYYTEFMGVNRESFKETDLVDSDTRNKLEKQLELSSIKNIELESRLETLEKRMKIKAVSDNIKKKKELAVVKLIKRGKR